METLNGNARKQHKRHGHQPGNNHIDPKTLEVKLKHPEYSAMDSVWAIYHFKNLLEEIDMPGEYYIDLDTKKLYLLPGENFSSTAMAAARGGYSRYLPVVGLVSSSVPGQPHGPVSGPMRRQPGLVH